MKTWIWDWFIIRVRWYGFLSFNAFFPFLCFWILTIIRCRDAGKQTPITLFHSLKKINQFFMVQKCMGVGLEQDNKHITHLCSYFGKALVNWVWGGRRCGWGGWFPIDDWENWSIMKAYISCSKSSFFVCLLVLLDTCMSWILCALFYTTFSFYWICCTSLG